MKRKKLYTRLTSKPKLIHRNNVFDEGGNLRWDRLASNEYGINYGDNGYSLSDYKNSKNSLGISKQNNPFSKGNIGGTMGAIASAVSAPVGNMLGNAISGGYSSGAGSAISNLGGAVGAGISTVNPLLGAGVTVGSKVLGGVTNALFGMKTNKQALNNDGTAINAYRSFNSNASSYDDIPTLTSFGNFVNPYKGGVFSKGKARRRNDALRNQFNETKSFAERSVDNNISNIADNNMNMALANYSAFGGPLDIMSNGNGAIDYNFMTDYLTMKNNQAQAKNNTVGYLGNIPSEPVTFADGGGIHIAKSKEGTYKAAADRRGISMSELADRIKANPENYSLALREKANFYNNFARHKKSDGGNLLIGNNGDTLFALGGDMQTNGADFGDNLVSVNAGDTHENNEYGGVQMGVAPDGSPNLVEEGETIFKDEDYVFSNRIKPKKEVLKKFHMYSKGGKLTYADVSKRLEKEAKERPNDPISKASLKDMLTQLMEAQEQQKAEEEAKEAKKAFEALSPEEQRAVLEQIAQQQQTQANTEQQANPQEEQEVPVDENGNPIEQPTEEMPNQEDIAQNDEGSMSAYGGKINKFPDGGKMIKQAILNAIKMKNGQRVLTKQMFDDWAKENNVTGFDYDGDWTKALQNESLKAALTKASPELAYAMANGYGTPYDVDNSPILNTDQTKGNWVEYMPQAWKGSADAFMKELQWDTINGMSNKEFADAVRNTNAYKKTTEWLKNADNAKLYFNALLKDDNTPEGAKNWINTNVLDSSGNWIGGKYNYDTMLKPVREDNYVGSFWKSAVPATTPDVNKNLLVGKDGSISVIDNDDLTGLTKVGNPYKWTDANGNNTYTFYSMPETDANGNSKKTDDEYQAKHRPEWLRYAGLLGPAVGLGLWGAGVGKPNTKGLDAAMEYASQANGKADYMPIGDYLRYNPMDIWAQEYKNDANARATDRAIVNNNTTAGSKMAGLLANGYNSQIANANLFRQAQEYNDAQKQKVAEFNRGTNMFNAEAYNRTSQTNAELQNRNAQFRANLAAQIANQKMNADSQWYNSLYGNIGSLFQGISDMGRENAQHNMIADMAVNGIFGNMTNKTPIAGTFIRKKNKSAKGGKLKRRRGLTF